MGGCCSSDSESSQDFRKRKNVNADEFDGPIKSRGCTDVQYLVLFIAFIFVWAGLVGYTVSNGDLKRILEGYDDCGYICGMNNPQINNSMVPIDCSQRNLTAKKLMRIYPKSEWSTHKRECVAECPPGTKLFFNRRCIPEGESPAFEIVASGDVTEFFEKAAKDIKLCSAEIIYLCLFALGLSVFMILLFRYFAGFLVWFVLICVVIVSVGFTTYLWLKWIDARHLGDQPENKKTTYFVYAILATLATVIILLLIFGMRKNIHLVAHLFEESGKAVQAMPLVVCQPFVTFVAVCALLFLWAYCFLWIESSGFPRRKIVDGVPVLRITFKKDEVIQFARVFNFIAIFWMVQFFIGCQHMIISGAVSTWFFTRKKNTLDSPISKSYGYLFNYHLGTVALGSLLIAIVQIIRVIFSAVKSLVKEPKNDFTRSLYKCFSCCLYCLEKILVYLTRNAYIEVAIFGDNLWTSGKRAYHVLVNNALRVAAINSVGDFVLFLGKALVVASSILIGFKLLQDNLEINYIGVPLTIIGVFAYFVAHAFMTAFEMIIDTIFICFCEDCDMNDGQQNPYFMSKGLMEFVEKSQKVLKVGDATTVPKSQTSRFLED